MNINKYIPTYVIDSIFKMDPKDVLKKQYKVILSDLDNTLDCYLNECPSDEVKNKIKQFQENGIEFIITSNNFKKRVLTYTKDLNVKTIWLLLKPYTFRLKRFLKKHHINKDECLIIGDQLFTDIALANKIKIDSVLVKPLTNQDQKFTTYRRKKEKKLLKLLTDNNKFNQWR